MAEVSITSQVNLSCSSLMKSKPTWLHQEELILKAGLYFCCIGIDSSHLISSHLISFHFICSLTARVVGAPPMILQPVSSMLIEQPHKACEWKCCAFSLFSRHLVPLLSPLTPVTLILLEMENGAAFDRSSLRDATGQCGVPGEHGCLAQHQVPSSHC